MGSEIYVDAVWSTAACHRLHFFYDVVDGTRLQGNAFGERGFKGLYVGR